MPFIRNLSKFPAFFAILIFGTGALSSCNRKLPPDPSVQRKMEAIGNHATQLLLEGRRRESMRYIDSAYSALPKITDEITAVRLRVLAYNYATLGAHVTSLTYMDSVSNLVAKHSLSDSTWRHEYVLAYTWKGLMNFQLGRLNEAADCYFKAKAQSAGRICDELRALEHYIGLTLYKQRKYYRAKDYFANAIHIIDSCYGYNNKSRDKVELLSNIALCYDKLEKLDSARIFYNKGLRFLDYLYQDAPPNSLPKIDEASYQVNRAVIFGNIGQLHAKLNQVDSAEALFKESIALNLNYKIELQHAQFTQVHLARLYLDHQRLASAELILADLGKSLTALKNREAELNWWQMKYRLAESLGKSPEALLFYKKYTAMNDSIAAIESVANSTDITKELQNKSQELEISLLKKGNQLNQLYLWITVTLSVLAVLIIALIYYYFRKGKANIRALTLLNQEVGEQKGKLEFAMTELGKSNMNKDRILKIVAHDLRNPISGIAQLTRSIIADDMPREDEKQSLSLIERASANSLNLINELLELDVSPEKINLDKQLLDICETIKECVELMQLSADKKGQKLQLNLPSEPILVLFNQEKMERVFNNLIGNAIKFSPRGEKIVVEVTRQVESVLITIADLGMGIAKNQQQEIFNTFTEARMAISERPIAISS